MGRAECRVVDFHAHAFPDHVAPKAIGALVAAYGGSALTDGTVSGLLEWEKAAGVDCAVLMPVATRPGQVASINDWAASLAEASLIPFGAIHPDCQDVRGEIDRIVSLGLPGIKIHPNWQDLYADERRMYPIYEAAEGRLIVMFHCGAELGPIDEVKAVPSRLARVLSDFPRLTAVAAHMGGYLMWDEADECLVGRDLYLDTSASYAKHLPDERFLGMIRRHGAEKVLFATDMPLNDPRVDIRRLEALGLTDAELEAILGGNARGLLGARPDAA